MVAKQISIETVPMAMMVGSVLKNKHTNIQYNTFMLLLERRLYLVPKQLDRCQKCLRNVQIPKFHCSMFQSIYIDVLLKITLYEIIDT
jgi:Na+/glutamate symporter